jgi:hypothetical protein
LRRLLSALHDLWGRAYPVRDPQIHLRETMQWLCRAQDATDDGGVSRSYALRYMRAHRRKGWLASYPETTGYIIPTFLAYATLTGDIDYRERAIRMARWESGVQMNSGAVQGGVIGFPPTPAIFNTGQVLFGWAAAYRETGDELFLRSAMRAADFLVEAQDADGAWRRHGSQYARGGVNVYDARSAWGLLEAYRVTAKPGHKTAVIRNLDFALSRQQPNGWYAECCLDDDERPLLHTIAYTMEGLLESGAILNEPRYIEGARKTADALLGLQRRDGSLPGRFDRQWKPAARWSCLTGDAQTAIVWFRLAEITGEQRYAAAATRMTRYLGSTQNSTSSDPGIRGGIAGSKPIWQEYGTYEYLNWAAKFYADALMLQLRAGGHQPARS